MKACKHERVADFVEVHLAACQECGDNEYDIVKAKAVKLKAALTAANARVEELENAVPDYQIVKAAMKLADAVHVAQAWEPLWDWAWKTALAAARGE